MNIQIRPLSTIQPYDKNPRQNDNAVEAVAASLCEFGFRQPIVVDSEGTIVCGHTRYKAARQLGLDSVPVHVATDLSPDQAKAYRIADNQTASLAGWDLDLLPDELLDLQEVDFDLSFLGFQEDELAKFMDGELAEGLTDPDEVPVPPDKATTQPGDLWILGNHRLLCGDSTKAESYRWLMDGEKADLLLCDPPYNIDYTGRTKDALKLENDAMSEKDYRTFLSVSFRHAIGALAPGASFYVWHADSKGYVVRGALHDLDQEVRQCLIWKKQTMVMGRQDYQWSHEPCLYGWKSGAAHGWYSDRRQTTVMEFDRPFCSSDHPTMKPTALITYQMGNSTAPRGLVLDPFLGSGTTVIAAEQLGRRCFGMEISSTYCDVIVKRWEQFTGRKAERQKATESAA